MVIKFQILRILKSIVFVSGTMCMGIVLSLYPSHVAYGMNSTDERHLPSPAALRHFEEDKGLIHDYLSKVKEAELHFFWTTGRTLSNNPEYHANTKVDIGGAEYGQKFFPYIDKLLEISPKGLKVKLACDTMTLKSNETQIQNLSHKYKSRFEILPIEKVQENLLKTFSSYAEKINIIFNNAMQGSPVLTSDLYRVIAMVYGQGHESDITQTLFTYSDIDVFCSGMEGLSHAQLITALFNPVTKSPFYFGRSATNNDIIKLHITDIESYKEFCGRILDKVQSIKGLLTHFTKLHDMVKQCEKDSHNCSKIIFNLPPPVQNLMLTVKLATGPNFLSDQNIDTDLSYPSTTVGEWSAPEEVLDHTMKRYLATHPPSVLYWGPGDATKEEKDAEEAFTRDCDHYRTALAAAFYAKRFGDHHPFNLAVKQYLVDHFPYHATSFKTLLKLNFAFHNKVVETKVSNIYRLYPLSELPKNGPRSNKIYLNIQDDKLHYTLKDNNEHVLKGTFDLDISDYIKNIKDELGHNFPSDELLEKVMQRYEDKIFDEALQKNLIHKPEVNQHHLSYNDWKEKAFKNITGAEYNHYGVLTGLLKELGIEIPFSAESLNYQGS